MKFPLLNCFAPSCETHGRYPHFVFLENSLMSVRFRQVLLVFLIAAFGLSGCAGHYKFSDDEYRALGDPQPLNRGN